VKDVPEGATVVGVPAHRVRGKADSISQEESFEAYGAVSGLENPLMTQIKEMKKEMQALQRKVDELESGSEDTAAKWEVKQ
jgi:serine acetyltransferase